MGRTDRATRREEWGDSSCLVLLSCPARTTWTLDQVQPDFPGSLLEPSSWLAVAFMYFFFISYWLWVFGIPGHTLESSNFLCSQSPESPKVPRLTMSLSPLIHGGVGSVSQTCFLKPSRPLSVAREK